MYLDLACKQLCFRPRKGIIRRTESTESAQGYISQASEEIEGRVTKKLSKEFNRTESRILGALSKLDEFLLNPQVRTCSVALPGASRNSNSENRETTGDRSSDDSCPEVRFSSHHSGHLSIPEVEEYPHSLIRTILPVKLAINRFFSWKKFDKKKPVPIRSLIERRSYANNLFLRLSCRWPVSVVCPFAACLRKILPIIFVVLERFFAILKARDISQLITVCATMKLGQL